MEFAETTALAVDDSSLGLTPGGRVFVYLEGQWWDS
jgi:hypothetical protein